MSSMRSRGAAASRRTRSGIRPVYEDFKLSSEWKHENGVSVLLYQLPGFVKEQIRIIAESRGILRVRGERHISGNKWSRFQEEVVVPQDCNMTEIRAKFEGGVLRITMPQKITTSSEKHRVEEQSRKMDEPPRSSTPRPIQQPKPQEFQEGEPSSKPPTLSAIVEAPTMGTSARPSFSLPPKINESERQPLNLHGTTTPMKPPSVSPKKDYNIDRHYPDYSKPKVTKEHAKQEDFSNLMDSSIESNKGMPTSLIKENEHQAVASNVCNADEEVYSNALDHDKSNIYDLNKIDKYGKPLLKRLDEDKQLLMNMGVAVLVIVALSTHIAYSFAPNS